MKTIRQLFSQLKRKLIKPKSPFLVVKHDVLIADGKPNKNGRCYNLKDVTYIPESVAIFDSFEDHKKVIGRSTLVVDKDVIKGVSHITDSRIIQALRAGLPKPMYVVSQGWGDIDEKTNVVKNFSINGAILTDDPSDPRQAPVSIVD